MDTASGEVTETAIIADVPAAERLVSRHRLDLDPAAKLALLSDWFPATTRAVVYVDAGFSAIGV